MTGKDNPMLFLDEIHNISGWEKFARRMADNKNLFGLRVQMPRCYPKVLSCKRRVIITYDEEKTIEDEYGVIEIHFARGNTEYVYLRNFSKKHKKRQPFRVAFIFLGLRD